MSLSPLQLSNVYIIVATHSTIHLVFVIFFELKIIVKYFYIENPITVIKCIIKRP